MMNEKLAFLFYLSSALVLGNAFTTFQSFGVLQSSQSNFEASTATVRSNENFVLMMAKKGKRKRRRKQPPASSAPEGAEAKAAAPVAPPVVTTPEAASKPLNKAPPTDERIKTLDEIDSTEEIDVALIADIAKFKFEQPQEQNIEESAAPESGDGEPIPLPDIKQVLQKKAMEQMAKAEEEEKEATTVKIKRTDKAAMARLLEQDPYADADDSFFEEEEYGTVSALLGERAKPFLGIPTGPLQVGHTIGALVIVLMSFVEYPGFPLTNLPSALRGALQGGLGTIYAINAVLAVLAVFKAGERGQSALLWGAKTFTVGGIAFDQLTQLPTLAQLEEVKNRKGARAVKRNKKRNKY